MEEKELVDTLEVRQDIGSYEPVFKRAILHFWSDGSVTWVPRPQTFDRGVPKFQRDRFVGDSK